MSNTQHTTKSKNISVLLRSVVGAADATGILEHTLDVRIAKKALVFKPLALWRTNSSYLNIKSKYNYIAISDDVNCPLFCTKYCEISFLF